VGRAIIVDDVKLKRKIWQPGHDRSNAGGPDNPATVFAKLMTDRIELCSALHNVLPEPEGYSAAVLVRSAEEWRYSAT